MPQPAGRPDWIGRHHRGLALVRDKEIDFRQQRRIDRQRRRQIEHTSAAASADASDQRLGFVGRHFELGDKDRLGVEQILGHPVAPHAHIGAGGHGDKVLARARYHDHGTAGRELEVVHQTRIDAVVAERSEGDPGKAVAADGAREDDIGSGSARRQRLIGPFTTG